MFIKTKYKYLLKLVVIVTIGRVGLGGGTTEGDRTGVEADEGGIGSADLENREAIQFHTLKCLNLCALVDTHAPRSRGVPTHTEICLANQYVLLHAVGLLKVLCQVHA